jgi:PAS domain S-box-containing protein
LNDKILLEHTEAVYIGFFATNWHSNYLMKPVSYYSATGHLARADGWLGVGAHASRFLIIGLGLCILSWITGGAELRLSGAEDRAVQPLTRARDVLSLSSEEASHARPVQLKGVILYYDPSWDLCFVSDSTAGIYLWRVNPELGLRDGHLVEVSGTSSSGRYSPIVVVSNLVITGTGAKPAPRRISFQELSSGNLDCQWIEVSGVVRSEGDSGGRWSMDLVTGDEHLPVFVMTNKPPTAAFRDARIRVRGVATAQGNEMRQFNGYVLMVPSLSEVEVLEEPSKEPFSLPVSAGRSLLSYSTRDNWEHQVHVQGVVTLHIPGEAIYVKDYSGGFRIRTKQTRVLRPGTRVDVVGFGSRGGITPQLTDAIIREAGLGPLPKSTSINAVQALSGQFDCEMVQMTAEVVNFESSRDSPQTLFLKADQTIFKAYLLPRIPLDQPSPWTRGTQLRISGVCTVSAGENRVPKDFALWVGSAAGIEILRQPKEVMGVRQVLWALGLAGAVVLLGLGWTMLARFRVRQRNAVIKRREAVLETRYRDLFENAHDIIFTHDMQGRFTSVNKAGELLLGQSQSSLQGLNLVDFLVSEDRERYQSMLAQHATGVERQTCELELHAGSQPHFTLEVDTRLDYQEGKAVGIRGIARDITRRKQAEAALRRSEQELRRSLEERQRIAQDLHDDIIQSIYAIGLGLEDCRKRVTEDVQQAKKRLQYCLDELNRLIRKIRSFIGQMDTGTLSGPGFMVELQALLSTLGDQSQARVELNVDPLAVARLSPHQVPQLLLVAREGLSNSLRHSQSSHICLSLQAVDGKIRLEIKDNGTGFNVVSAAQKGNGLRNITARACQLGANLNIESQPGSGTSIALDLTPDETIYASN